MPTYYLLGVGQTGYCTGTLQNQVFHPTTSLVLWTGAYNPVAAANELQGLASAHIPVKWNSPVLIVSLPGWGYGAGNAWLITGDAIAVSSNGAEAYAAYTNNGTSYLFESINQGAWTSLTPNGVTGVDPQLAFGGAAVVMTTRTATSLAVSTYFLSGIASASVVLPVSVRYDSVTWYPTEGMGQEALAASTTNGQIVLYSSLDGGHTFSSQAVANYSVASANQSAMGGIGSTRLSTPAGYPGQVAISVVGLTLFVLYTTNISSVTAAATTISVNGGIQWTPPDITTLTNTSIVNPSLAPSSAGYMYAAWLENSPGGWSVDAPVYGEDGRLIQSPAPLPGTSPVDVSPFAYTGVTVDSFGRPFYAWDLPYAGTPSIAAECSKAIEGVIGGILEPSTTGCTAGVVQYTAAFLSPANILSVLRQHVASLGAWDYKLGTLGSLTTQVPSLSSEILANLSALSANHTYSNLCQAQNLSANSLYANVTHIQFSNSSSSSICGNFAFAVASTTSPLSGGIPQPPPNYYWSKPVAMALGPMAANTYLGVIADWLLESVGVPITFSGDPLRGFNPVSSVLPALPTPFPGSTTVGSQKATASVMPSAYNPITGDLIATTNYPTQSTTWYGSVVKCQKSGQYQNVTTKYVLTATLNYTGYRVSVENNSGHVSATYSGSTSPTIWLNNLTPNATMLWNGTFTGYYAASLTTTACSVTTAPVGLPYHSIGATVAVNVAGTVTTTLRTVPWPPSIVITGSSSLKLGYFWNNTMLATASSSLTALSNNQVTQQSSSALSVPVALTGTNYSVTANAGYAASMTATSSKGSYSNAQNPGVSANEEFSSPALSTSFGCTFTAENNPVSVSKLSVSNVSGGNATVAWESNVQGSGWAQFFEMGVATNLTQTATVTGSGSTYWYHAQLHGLAPGTLFYVTVTTSVGIGCVAYQAGNSTTFNTVGRFALYETDLPYDSITAEGGGAVITWQLPSNVTRYPQANGSLVLVNDTSHPASVVYPIQLSEIAASWDPGFFNANITPTQLNGTYTAEVFLNFTASVSGKVQYWNLTSRATTFVYERDTSGDGLTDAEKLRGWWVPLSNVVGGATVFPAGGANGGGVSWVTANPKLYATNGLVSDFVEKEFLLDPNTVDTAGSHMLDTWNLTFNLGATSQSPSPPVGANFRYWNENASYNPFGVAQYPGGPKLSAPVSQVTNTTPQDNSPWAAEVLWPRTALSSFDNLTGVLNAGWLRAVFGTWGSDRTLTVWGKLSWGANPDSASTPLNGIPDGFGVNPLGGVDLQVTVTAWSDSGLTKGDGVAAYIHANSSSAPYVSNNVTDYSNYTAEVTANTNGVSSYSGQFIVTFPVTETEQYATLNLSLVQNHKSTISSVVSSGLITADLTNPSLKSVTDGSSPTLSFTYQAVQVYSKAPTSIITPAGNSTFSPLPLGLKRYTGEQNFVLLEVNDTMSGPNSITVGSIPYPNANGTVSTGTYALNLSGGMDNILVPRSVFAVSPLGQVLLNGSENYSIASTSANSFLRTNWDPAALYARVTGNPSWNGSNDAPGKRGYIAVYSNSSQNCTANASLCGGVALNPQLEQSQPALAVEAVVVLNISTTSGLEDLLAGLLLNKTGNFTSWSMAATPYVESFGLRQVVLNALANPSLTNDGGYGAPKSVQSQPQGALGLSFSTVWNDVSGIGTTCRTGVLTACWSAIWNAATAAFVFAVDALKALAVWGLKLINTLPGLRAAEEAIQWAWQQAMTWVIQEVKQLISLAFEPLFALTNSAATGLNLSLPRVQGHGWTSQQIAQAVWNPSLVDLFVAGLLIAYTVIIGITALQAIALGTPSLVAGIIVGLFISAITAVLYVLYDSTLAYWGVQLVWAIEGFANCSSLGILGYRCQYGNPILNESAPVWAAFAVVAAVPETSFVTSTIDFAFGAWAAQLGALDAASFGVACVALALTWWVFAHPAYSAWVLFSSVLLSGVSIILDVLALLRPKSGATAVQEAAMVMDGVTMAMDGVSASADALKWACAYNWC